MNYKIQFKRGDSFSQIFSIPPVFSEGMLKDWTISAQLRVVRNDKLISDLDCSWVDPDTTKFILLEKNDTGNWPIGPAALDIRFTYSNGFTFSETVSVLINKNITK